MRRFFTLFSALILTTSVFSSINYQLNGGVTNSYGWLDKNDMFQACLADCGALDMPSLDELQDMYDAFTPVCGRVVDVSGFLYDDKWDWLELYILDVQSKDPSASLFLLLDFEKLLGGKLDLGDGSILFGEAIEQVILVSEGDHIADLVEEKVHVQAVGGIGVLVIGKAFVVGG